MYFLYNLGLNIIFLASLPYTATMLLFNRQQMRSRWGWYGASRLKEIGDRHPVWFHAASMGEVAVIAPIIAAVHKQRPAYPIIVSTVTATGLSRARQVIPEACLTFILPLDVPWIIKRVVKLLRPRSLFIAETELWPNLLRYTRRNAGKVVLINGTLSNRSYRRYRRLGPFTRRVLSYFDFLSVKGPADREKFLRLGAPRHLVEILGNIKFDFSSILKHESLDSKQLLAEWCLPPGRPIFIAGSTRPGEEPIILEAFQEVRKTIHDLLCILAPRHLNRVTEIEQLLKRKQLVFCRKTRMAREAPPDLQVLVLDTMGELQKLYAVGQVVFIGGSLIDFGGHNPLEPAIYRVPILFGPYMEMNQLSATLLLEKGGAIQVQDQADLVRQLTSLLSDPERRHALGERAYQVIQENKGIVDRYVAVFFQKGLV